MALETLNNRYDIRHFDEGGSTSDPIAGLYQSVLGRDPDAGGLAFWQNAAQSGTSFEDIQNAFTNSEEAQAKKQAQAQSTGINDTASNNTGALSNVTVQSAGSEFNNAQAITPTYGSTAAISDWYKNKETGLGREADIGGLNYWAKEFGDTLDPNEIEILQSSPEYQNRNFLTGLYENKLGREYDQGGYDFWMNALNTGASKQDIQNAFIGSPEYQTSKQLSDLYQSYYGELPNSEKLKAAKEMLASGKTLDEVNDMYAADPTVAGNITKFLENEYQENLGRAPDEGGLEFWKNEIISGRSSLQDVERAIATSQEGTTFLNDPIVQSYQTYFGRLPDAEGLANWRKVLSEGRSLDEVKRDLATSQESIDFNLPSVTALLETTLGKDIVSQLTPQQLAEYTKLVMDPGRVNDTSQFASASEFDPAFYLRTNEDVAAAGVDPYSHYVQHGYGEGRAPFDGTKFFTKDENLREVYKQIALDPVLGAKLKAENPTMWEQVTPLTNRPDELVRTERISYGQFGTVNVNGVAVPILNARRADQILGYDQFGEVGDFSHSRGNLTKDLGWGSNSFSNKIARGANAIGVTATQDSEGNMSYQGLNEAAKLINIDPAQFKDKQVPATEPVDRYDENGSLLAKAGDPIMQGGDWYEAAQPVMKTITAQDQLYDAINQASKDIYLYTGDSLTPDKAREGGAESFNTVLYKRVGDELIPISKPVAHGGAQNMDTYRPKDYGFGYYAQGPAFVAAAALSFAMADPTFSLAAAVGSAMLPAAAATAIGTTATGIVGATVLGAAAGALSSTAAGGNIEKGALTGAVTGMVASSMKPLLSSKSVLSATESIANASQGVFSQAQVGNIIGATIASTLASAANGANGTQILNSFKTALISSGLSEKAAQLAVAGVKEAFGDDPKTLARTAAATRLVTRTASTAALSGKNPEQIQAAVIATLVQNAANIAAAGSNTKGVTKDGSGPKNNTSTALGESSTQTAGLTQEEFDVIQNQGGNQAVIQPGSTQVAGGTTATDVLPTSTETALNVAGSPTGNVSVTGISNIEAYNLAKDKYGMSDQAARDWANSTGGNIEISGVGQNPDKVLDLFVPDPNAVLPDIYSIMDKSQNTTAGGGFTQSGSTFVRGLPIEVIEAIIADTNAPQNVKQEAEKVKQEQIIKKEEEAKKEEEKKKATKGGGNDSGGTSETVGGGGTSTTTGGSAGATGTAGEKTSAQEAQQTELVKQAEKASDAAKGDEQAEIVIAVSLVAGLIGSGSSSTDAIKKASKATGLSEAQIKAALDAKNGTKDTGGTSDIGGTGGTGGTTGGGDTTGTGGGGVGTGTQSGVGAGEGTGGGTGGGAGTGTGGGTGDGSGTGGGTGGGTGVGAGGGSGTGTGTGTGKGSGSGSGSGTGITSGNRGIISPFLIQEYGGIQNLAPGLTGGGNYSLSGIPSKNTNMNPMIPNAPLQQFAATSPVSPLALGNPQQQPQGPIQLADGGSTTQKAYNPYDISSGISGSLTPGLTKARLDYILTGLPQNKAEGGSIEGHNPQFFSEGGLGSMDNTFVQGDGDGTSDQVPAMLANGEFVIPADVVSGLGNGSNDAGAEVLHEFLKAIREHKHSAQSDKLPPKSKGALAYLTNAKRKVKVA